MALIAALLGWMFDGAEMGVFSMVGRRAIGDLMGYSKAMPGAAELLNDSASSAVSSFDQCDVTVHETDGGPRS